MQDTEQHIKEIAQRLRGLRDGLDLSAEDLAAKVAVSVEDVVAYESGDREIPVSFLFKAAQACNADLTSLLTGTEARLRLYSVVRKGEGMPVDRRPGYVHNSLAARFSHRAMEPFRVKVPPKGADHGPANYSAHKGQEFIYLLAGTLEIILGDETVVLEQGDSIYFDSQTPHSMAGLNGTDAEFLDVII